MVDLQEMQIRRAQPQDARVVAAFNAALAWETEQVRLERETLDAGVLAVLHDSAKGLYFVAEIGGRVVGQLMITYEWSDWRNGNIWWLQSVYVHVDFRKHGVFRALYEHARSIAINEGAVALRLYVDRENSIGQRTYQRLGMNSTNYLVMEAPLRVGRIG